MEQKYWGKPGGRAQTFISLPVKLNMCPTKCAAGRLQKKKKLKILGSYKPKQLKASQPSTRQNEPSTSQEEREPTLPGSSNGIESTGA